MPEAKENSLTLEQRFLSVVSGRAWRQTQEVVGLLDAANFWASDELRAAAEAKFKSDFVRRMLRSLRREDGEKAFVNVKIVLEGGEKANVYKQETLFNVEDYRYAVNYYKGMGITFINEANRLARNCRTRGLDKQMPLPFPSFA